MHGQLPLVVGVPWCDAGLELHRLGVAAEGEVDRCCLACGEVHDGDMVGDGLLVGALDCFPASAQCVLTRNQKDVVCLRSGNGGGHRRGGAGGDGAPGTCTDIIGAAHLWGDGDADVGDSVSVVGGDGDVTEPREDVVEGQGVVAFVDGRSEVGRDDVGAVVGGDGEPVCGECRRDVRSVEVRAGVRCGPVDVACHALGGAGEDLVGEVLSLCGGGALGGGDVDGGERCGRHLGGFRLGRV